MTKCSSYCFQILYCKQILFAAILFCSFLGIYWLGVVKFCNTSSGNGTLDFQTIYTHTHYKAFKIVWFTHLYLKKQKQTKQYLGKPFSDYKLRRLEQIFLTSERFFVLNFFILNRYILMNLYTCSFFYYLRLVVFIQLQSISVAMIY